MHNVSKPPKTVCMMQTELTKRAVAQIGEAIPHELGAQMIRDFQIANPSEIKSYLIGREIIDQILAQPGCAGIRFYNAYNEQGEKTMVYVGMDQNGEVILTYSSIVRSGQLETQKAIVADRIRPNSTPATADDSTLADDWNIFF